MSAELYSARWVHDREGYVRRRALAIATERAVPMPVAYELASAEVYSEVAIVGLPGNTQRPWDGKHAKVSDGRTESDRRTIRAAIARRKRRAAKFNPVVHHFDRATMVINGQEFDVTDVNYRRTT